MSHTKFVEENAAGIAVKCDHEWEWISDWYGDPGVVNGTADCSHYRCSLCGAEEGGEPPDDSEFDHG